MAAKFGVELVMYGENQAEYGNNVDDNYIPTMDRKFFSISDPLDIVLGGNRHCSSVQISPFFLVFLVKAFRQDQGPGFFRSKGVFDSDFNLRLDRPFHRERMQHFRTEIGQFCCFRG